MLQRESNCDGRLRMLSIGLHPRISGQAGRASAVEQILELLLSNSSVWIATRRDIAEFWIEHVSPASSAH